MNWLLKAQFYILAKRQAFMNRIDTKTCLSCSEEVVPRKEISTLNLLGYLIIGIIVFMITKRFMSFLIPVILGILNGLFTKPRCPKCKKQAFKNII